MIISPAYADIFVSEDKWIRHLFTNVSDIIQKNKLTFFSNELSIIRDESGIGVSYAYLLIDGIETIVLKDETIDLLGINGEFTVTMEVDAVKDTIYNVELYAADTKSKKDDGPNSGLVDSTYISVPHDIGKHERDRIRHEIRNIK